MNNQYELIIRVDGGGSGNSSTPAADSGSATPNSGGGTSFRDFVKNFAKVWSGAALLKQAISYGVSRVGVETGNMQAQATMGLIENVATKVIDTGIAFALNPVLGLTKIASEGLSLIQQFGTFKYDQRMEGIALEQARLRAGSAVNRSRAFETNA